MAATTGELPVPAQPAPIGEQTTVRRRKVSLTAPPASARPAEDDEERVYVAPPDGLGKFDLGSVPASVTPPRSWRKAAWFASLSSGFVVVALLVAGTVLVGQPVDDRQAIGGWTDRHGGVAPTLPNEQYAGDETSSAPESTESGTNPAEDTGRDDASSTGDRLTSPTGQMAAPPVGTGGQPGPSRAPGSPSAPPSSSAEPKKPPVTPARTTKAPGRYVFPQHDADEMGQVSQDFLNTVTEDPAQAHALTTGKLAQEGPEGLRRKYADVAYFEVKHVYIEPNEGYTINTVEVTHPDGSTTEETCKLVFGEDTKIADDGK
ncbi:hypothetical protein BAY60_08265 [Prauserella muralis]|uniref:Uncharacterized protein n=1 Tax=Prauserella muralis TaxID=588067 RepID=A0A2V4BQK3_9PSEU|nr:hypothetical protein BAY60_08265 [Prauserella muralis]